MAESEEIRVLVVDDNRDEAESLAALLELSGYAVKVATGAGEALALLPEFDPQCLMVDIDMPGMSGIDLSEQLRKSQREDLVIIAVTGWGHADQSFTSEFDCFDYCLRKPVDPRRLHQLLPALGGD